MEGVHQMKQQNTSWLRAKRTSTLENSFGATKRERANIGKENIGVAILHMPHMKAEAKKLLAIMEKEGEEEINNMYERTIEEKGKWKCPLCGEEGRRQNKYFGVCQNKYCGGVRTDNTYQNQHTIDIKTAHGIMLHSADSVILLCFIHGS